MKNLTLLIVILLASIQVQAQDDALLKTVNVASQGLCDCVNRTYGFIDADVKKAFMEMLQFKTKEEQTSYITSLDEELLNRLSVQASKMEDDQTEAAFNQCVERIQYQVEKAARDYPDTDITEEMFMGMLMNDLSTRQGCEFSYFLIQMGLQQPSDNSGQVKSDEKKINKKSSTTTDDNNGDERYGSGGN